MFTKIDARLWSDECYLKLSDDGKLLFVYILSCHHRNMIGIYSLPIPYGSFDLNWTIERFTKGLDELSSKGFIKYNNKTHIVFIKNFLKYNPLENPNQVKGAIKALDTIPTNAIDRELVEYLKTVEKPFLEPLIKLLSKGLGKQEDVYEDEYVDVKEDTADNDYSKIVQAFQNNGFGLINQGTKDKLVDLIETYSSSWTLEAIEIAVTNNVRNLGYVNGILKKWKAEGKDNNGKNNPGHSKESEGIDWAERAGVQSF